MSHSFTTYRYRQVERRWGAYPKARSRLRTAPTLCQFSSATGLYPQRRLPIAADGVSSGREWRREGPRRRWTGAPDPLAVASRAQRAGIGYCYTWCPSGDVIAEAMTPTTPDPGGRGQYLSLNGSPRQCKYQFLVCVNKPQMWGCR